MDERIRRYFTRASLVGLLAGALVGFASGRSSALWWARESASPRPQAASCTGVSTVARVVAGRGVRCRQFTGAGAA